MTWSAWFSYLTDMRQNVASFSPLPHIAAERPAYRSGMGANSSRRANLARAAAMTGLGLSGCSPAPSQDILGSFFPAWILCAALGVVAAFVCKALLNAAGVEKHIFAPPVAYLAIAVSVTLLIWLYRFGN